MVKEKDDRRGWEKRQRKNEEQQNGRKQDKERKGLNPIFQCLSESVPRAHPTTKLLFSFISNIMYDGESTLHHLNPNVTA